MSYGHITSEERYVIYHLTLCRLSNREIGRRLGRHHTTFAREVERNGPQHGGVYWPSGLMRKRARDATRRDIIER